MKEELFTASTNYSFFLFYMQFIIIIEVLLHGLTYRKKQKVCSTSSHRSISQVNDVTADSGINLEVRFLVTARLNCNLDKEKRIN